jgi:hypothetical protein
MICVLCNDHASCAALPRMYIYKQKKARMKSMLNSRTHVNAQNSVFDIMDTGMIQNFYTLKKLWRSNCASRRNK